MFMAARITAGRDSNRDNLAGQSIWDADALLKALAESEVQNG
jgi:hypothetical protein